MIKLFSLKQQSKDGVNPQSSKRTSAAYLRVQKGTYKCYKVVYLYLVKNTLESRNLLHLYLFISHQQPRAVIYMSSLESICDQDQDFLSVKSMLDHPLLNLLITWFSVVQRSNCSWVFLIPWSALKKGFDCLVQIDPGHKRFNTGHISDYPLMAITQICHPLPSNFSSGTPGGWCLLIHCGNWSFCPNLKLHSYRNQKAWKCLAYLCIWMDTGLLLEFSDWSHVHIHLNSSCMHVGLLLQLMPTLLHWSLYCTKC